MHATEFVIKSDGTTKWKLYRDALLHIATKVNTHEINEMHET